MRVARRRSLEHDMMQQQEFTKFFEAATGHRPYLYQSELATSGSACASRLISVPTGMGKTAAVALAWLWNRVMRGRGDWPRRLVYCLPMRTLVEQTRDEIQNWLRKLSEAHPENADLHWLAERSPVILMGGVENDDLRREWDVYPEKPAILIGTQDMLLSRALNRGYGMSRARWPMHFALLNNDCLWVMDEVQLMGAGLWTSAQLDWLRQDRFKPVYPCCTWWMSATISPTFLETKDRTDSSIRAPEKLEANDIINPVRPVSDWQPKESINAEDRGSYIAALVEAIRSEHDAHTLSLVVCNTVLDAQEVFAAFGTDDDVVLITSRFRPPDREANFSKLLEFEKARKKAVAAGTTCPHRGLICVSTQVVEAGLDISSRRLWTAPSPWPSFLQRLGRLNRDGQLNNGSAAFLFEIPTAKKSYLPYDPKDVEESKKIIGNLVEKSKKEPTKPIHEILDTLDTGKALEPKPTPFPRAIDVHGLFSTEPDVFGGFTDVSAWVRGTDRNADVTVFWRDWESPKKSPNAEEYSGPAFQRDEGCAVSVYRLRDFLETQTAFIWDDCAERWTSVKPTDVCPGMVVLLPVKGGGYDERKGWTGDKADKPRNAPPPGPFHADGVSNDKLTTAQGQWVALDTHQNFVVDEAKEIAKALALPDAYTQALVSSAELHDIGKSLPKWQDALPTPRPDGTTLWAKAPSQIAIRPGLRHEAASALAAWRQYYQNQASDLSALAIYLIAAHHGLVRTVLGSRPAPAEQPNVAGIPVVEPPPSLPFNNWQLDFSPAIDGAKGVFSEDGSTFVPSSPSWTALVADLLGGWEAGANQPTAGAVPALEPHSLNPFRLACLEMLLRAADGRASAKTQEEIQP
jgi:CRISPR-associated endonuclease/helicase Cas3